MLILACLVISDPYLFHLIVILNPAFNSSNKLSSSVDRMTTGTYNFVFAVLNVASVGLLISATVGSTSGSVSLVALLVITQFSDHVKIKFISQLISGIPSVLQIFLRCFYGTTISTSFSVLLPSNLPVIIVL